jgi:hypothetical protein
LPSNQPLSSPIEEASGWHAICDAWRGIDHVGEKVMRACLVFVLLLTALTATSASATITISDDIGGKMRDYTTRFRQVRDSGEPVVISGTCVSACTMVLGLVPIDRICATPNAVLGFHAAWMFDDSGKRVVSASGTQDLMDTYPATVRAWIARHGGLTRKMMYLRGRDLAAIVAPCNSSHTASASRAKRLGGFHQDSDTNTPRASFNAR